MFPPGDHDLELAPLDDDLRMLLERYQVGGQLIADRFRKIVKEQAELMRMVRRMMVHSIKSESGYALIPQADVRAIDDTLKGFYGL